MPLAPAGAGTTTGRRKVLLSPNGYTNTCLAPRPKTTLLARNLDRHREVVVNPLNHEHLYMELPISELEPAPHF